MNCKMNFLICKDQFASIIENWKVHFCLNSGKVENFIKQYFFMLIRKIVFLIIYLNFEMFY